MRRIFIGYDPDETVALHVLSHSILRHAKEPVAITPLVLPQLPMTRPRDPAQTSDFTFTRYLVPWLCGYEGQALYMDSDMLVRCDIAAVFAAADPEAQISVVKHDYTPKDATKFLGKVQTRYKRKNWSSVMVFNCERCTVLSPGFVNTAEPSILRKLHWANSIAELPREFNHLVGEYAPNPAAKIVHFTLGTPCFGKYRNCEFAQAWREEEWRMRAYQGWHEYSRPDKVPA